MELLNGGELFDKIVDIGSFPEPEAALVFARLLASVEFLHARNIVHRDLKPENILFGRLGGWRLTVGSLNVASGRQARCLVWMGGWAWKDGQLEDYGEGEHGGGGADLRWAEDLNSPQAPDYPRGIRPVSRHCPPPLTLPAPPPRPCCTRRCHAARTTRPPALRTPALRRGGH